MNRAFLSFLACFILIYLMERLHQRIKYHNIFFLSKRALDRPISVFPSEIPPSQIEIEMERKNKKKPGRRRDCC